MLNNIFIALIGLCSAVGFTFFTGKRSERNKQNNKILKSVRDTTKRRSNRINNTVDDDLNWLLSKDKNNK